MEQLLDQILNIAVRAGEEIIAIYENEFDVDYKQDGSPLTLADRRAHNLIQSTLEQLDSDIPVMSEESSKAVFEQRGRWNRFWLVDPLDGTKEFVKRNGEFTVNIALIENNTPILGVVHAPVMNVSHYAAIGVGAFKIDKNSSPIEIRVKDVDPRNVIMVASRSHSGPEVAQYQKNLEQGIGPVDITSMGSSLKICLVAEGSADIYPRLGPTSEWDTAAAHCVLEVAGGQLTDIDGRSLTYNKPDIINPWFLASGARSVDWTRYL